MNMAELQTGTYLLRVQGSDWLHTQRITIIR